MLVLLAVSLLLADCAQYVRVSGCLSVCVRVSVLWLRVLGWMASLSFAMLSPFLCLQRLSPPGAPSLVCLNGAPVLSAEGRGLQD